MSDLDGDDAFREVLDRLIGAERSIATEDAEKRVLHASILDRNNQIVRLQSAIADLKTADKEKERRLNELHEAASAFRLPNTDEPSMDRLRKALDAAARDCDVIQF